MAKIRQYFTRHPDASWEARVPVTINRPGKASVTINPGDRYRRGVLFYGLDIADLCERDADI